MKHSESMLRNSQSLRTNMTKEEKHLWYDFLKLQDFIVKRQYVIDRYILDFYIPASKIAIELDGAQHYEQTNRENDAQRDAFLTERGMLVLRYTNIDFNRNFDGICQDILSNHSKRILD